MEGNELIPGEFYRMTMRFFINKQPGWPRANVTKSERIEKPTGTDRELAEKTSWTERKVDPSENVEPPNAGAWMGRGADGERPKFRKMNKAPPADDDEPLAFGTWKPMAASLQEVQVTHTDTAAPLLSGPRRPLNPPQSHVPPRDPSAMPVQDHAVGAR